MVPGESQGSYLLGQDAVGVGKGEEPGLPGRLSEIDIGPGAALLEMANRVAPNVAPADAQGPKQIDKGLVQIHAPALLGIDADMLKHVPPTPGLQAPVQLRDILGRIWNAAETQHRDDTVYALGRDASCRERVLDSHGDYLVHVVKTRCGDLGTQRPVDGGVRLDAVDVRDARSLARGGRCVRVVQVGRLWWGVRWREQRYPHAGAGTDFKDGAAYAGGGRGGGGHSLAVEDALWLLVF